MSSCTEHTSTNNKVQSRVEYLPYYNEANFTPHWIHPKDKVLNEFHQISPFQLYNQDGETITEKTFDGKIYVTDFFFTVCPGICPKMTANLSIIQEAFKDDDDILLLSHSVTPKIDSIPKLKAYAEEKGVISGKWHLVTGKRKDIYELGRNNYFVEENMGLEKSESDFLHTENFVLIDKNKHIRGIYNGLSQPAIQQLIADIKILKEE
jgi:protein SCO1/2